MFRIIYIAAAAAAVVLGLPVWANESNSGGSATTEFTTTGDAAIAWGEFTDFGHTEAASFSTTHDPADAGKLALYFLHSDGRGRDFTPSGTGWELLISMGGVSNQLGSQGLVAKVLDGVNDDLSIPNDTYTSVSRVLIPNAGGEIFVKDSGANGTVPNPATALDTTGATANYLSIVYAGSYNAWFPDAPPTGYGDVVTNDVNTLDPNKQNIASKRVVGVTSEDPDAWGTVATTGRAAIFTILVKEKSAAAGYLRTGTEASHLGAGVTLSESVIWGKSVDNGGFFVVKNGDLSITSDTPSSAPYDVTGYTPITNYGTEIIASDGTGTLVGNGIMKGADMTNFGLVAEPKPEGTSLWHVNNKAVYDPTLNYSPTATGNGAYTWPVNEVLVKGKSVPGDPYTYVSPLGFGANNSGNQYRYNEYFIPMVHLSEEPREGMLMPPLINWDQTNLHSIEPEPASPPASSYTWHHADLSVFDPANLPLKDNGNYNVTKEEINGFLGAMNTWFNRGQKQGGNTGANTQNWYNEVQGEAAAAELKYLLGPDTLENKKSVIASIAAYGLQGLAALEWFRDNKDVGPYYPSKAHSAGQIPAILLCYVIFPNDTALRARITAYMDGSQNPSLYNAGIETQTRVYADTNMLHEDDYYTVKSTLRGRYTVADMGLPDWAFLEGGYIENSVATVTGHSWMERYREQNISGTVAQTILAYQFGGYDAVTGRTADIDFLDRLWNFKTELAREFLTMITVRSVTSAFTVGETVTIAGSGSGTIIAIDELVGSTLLWTDLDSGNGIVASGVVAVTDTGGGAGDLVYAYSQGLFGGVGGQGAKLSDAVDDTTSLYPTIIGPMIAAGTYIPYAGNPERTAPPRLSLSGSSIVVTPSHFKGLNGNNYVRTDYRWQLMDAGDPVADKANRLNDGIIGSEVNGVNATQNGAWTVQLDGGDTSFTTPSLPAGNYRVQCRVVNDSTYLGGVGSWSSNHFYRSQVAVDQSIDGMATITVK